MKKNIILNGAIIFFVIAFTTFISTGNGKLIAADSSIPPKQLVGLVCMTVDSIPYAIGAKCEGDGEQCVANPCPPAPSQ